MDFDQVNCRRLRISLPFIPVGLLVLENCKIPLRISRPVNPDGLLVQGNCKKQLGISRRVNPVGLLVRGNCIQQQVGYLPTGVHGVLEYLPTRMKHLSLPFVESGFLSFPKEFKIVKRTDSI